jgi:hypothetical protein
MVKSDSPSDPSKFPSFQDFNQGNKTFLPSKIKTECKKTAKGMDMLSYFHALSDDARKEIFDNLQQNKDEEDYVKNSKRTPTFFSSADAIKSDPEKAKLYDLLMQEKCKAEVAMKYGNKNVPSHKLLSILLITLAARNDKDLGKVSIILCKHNQGSDASLRKKTRDTVVKSFDLKISSGNISLMLTSTDVAE